MLITITHQLWHLILEVSSWGLGISLLYPSTQKGGVGVSVTTPKPFVSLGPERPGWLIVNDGGAALFVHWRNKGYFPAVSCSKSLPAPSNFPTSFPFPNLPIFSVTFFCCFSSGGQFPGWQRAFQGQPECPKGLHATPFPKSSVSKSDGFAFLQQSHLIIS